jgi:3-dehydroquinate synthase
MIVRTETIDQRIDVYVRQYNPDKIIVVVSETSEKLCLPKLQIYKKINHIIYHLPDGDKAKSLRYCEDFWESLLRENVSRQSLIIAVGGGAVLDFTGFCASVYMRGIPCIYVPTTLLSMIDGSEGGKTGINLYGTKNIIGTFSSPVAVMRNIDFLESLNPCELLSGWAEIIKHALLNGGTLWDTVLQGMPPLEDTHQWMNIIRENIIYKKDIVSQDFKEKGLRKLLNLGHTFGHAIEAQQFENEKANHGICIANGIYWETLLSVEKGFTDSTVLKQLEDVLFPLYPKFTWNELDIQPMINLLKHDKKNHHGKLQFTLLENVGSANYNVEITPEEVADFLKKHAVSMDESTD